jgi:MFS family permease
VNGRSASLRNGARAFGHRNYRLFFGGQGVSLVGTWMQTVAQAWLILQLTSDPFMLGLLSAAQFMPVMVLGLFGGIVADALPKRQILIATQTSQMILAFVLFGLTVTGTVEVWQIMVLALLLGVTNAVDMPTRQAFAVEMVGHDDIQNAVALNSAMFNGARIVGPAVAGIAIGILGLAAAFLINALSFLAVIVAYAVMRDEDLHSPAHYHRPATVRAIGQTLGDGLRYVWRSPMLLLPITILGLVSTFGMNFSVVVPALADEVLKTDATGFGILMASTGVGSMTAALLIAFSGRSRPAVIGVGALVLGGALVAAGFITSFALSLAAMAFVGFGAIGMAATANTTIQLNVEDGYRGRVMSVYTTVFAGSAPIGGVLAGWLASTYTVSTSLLIAGVLCVVTGLAGILWLAQIRARGVSMVLSADPVGASTAAARPR